MPRVTLDPSAAWAPYEPTDSAPWDLSRVAHLHRRAGFSASWDVLQCDLKDGPEAAVAHLLDGGPTSLDGQPAEHFAAFLDQMAEKLGTAGIERLQGVWLYRMVLTPHPLQERLTLFWHDHFATSNAKVNNPRLMQRQNALLRRYALGDFGALLRQMARDPAMLAWLDSTTNRKTHPNENYAREVMELFTLGRGNYSERDVQEAARAFSGSFVRGDEFREVPDQHDSGPKTILGQTGAFDGDDVAEILLAQPACARFLVRKLYALLVNEIDEPSDDLIEPVAEVFRNSGYQVREPVSMILRSRLFFDSRNHLRRVKSPVELAVGSVRALEVRNPSVSAEALANACGRMGQALFAPPSVAGWDGGPAWINTTATLARANLALALLSDSDPGLGNRLDPLALASRHGVGSPEEAARFFIDLLVQDAFTPDLRQRVVSSAKKEADPKAAARKAAELVLTSPEYQLS
jgi:hypothetical protein